MIGGSEWTASAWAIFCVLAISVVVVQVLYDRGNQSDLENFRWKRRSGFVLVVGLLHRGYLAVAPVSFRNQFGRRLDWARGSAFLPGYVPHVLWASDLAHVAGDREEILKSNFEVGGCS